MAAELVRLKVDVLAATESLSAVEAKIAPSASRFAVFLDSAISPNRRQLQDLHAAASTMRLKLVPFEIKGADDVARVFAAMTKRSVDGLILLPGGVISSNQKRIAELAIETRTPSIYTAVWAEIGGLIAYGTDFNAYFRRAAVYVDKILKGTKPADLPIVQATTFQLVVNLRTAKMLGVTIPPTILGRADRVLR